MPRPARRPPAPELLDSAAIQLSEAHGEIQRHIDSVEIDPSAWRKWSSGWRISTMWRAQAPGHAGGRGELHLRLRQELQEHGGWRPAHRAADGRAGGTGRAL